jgi:PhzF family phenazine biosynthesis protein
MKIPMYQVDAFNSEVFRGNPAAICILGAWLPTQVMQAIASENNLSETAFLVPQEDGYGIRWFTPMAEIDLAGHPTLASAYVVFEILEPGRTEVRFESPKSGPLFVRQEGGLLAMDFPSRPPEPAQAAAELVEGLGQEPTEVLKSRDYMAVFGSEAEVAALQPRQDKLMELDCAGIIATAPGDEVDFVSRFFAPLHGIAEDPVTGSAHCTLIPYWAERLGKDQLRARQISQRVGELWCTNKGERVGIAGQAVLYLEGYIRI